MSLTDALVPTSPLEAHISPERLEEARSKLELYYAQVAASWPGFVARTGQYQMMHAALLTFLCAQGPGEEPRDGRNLAQLEAGTGTGKTVAYCLAAIVASEMLEKTVIVSTATVALQEQLFHKDLPRLAEIIPGLKFDILKGRGRYICASRLDGALHDDGQDGMWDEALQDAMADQRRQMSGGLGGAPRDNAEVALWLKNVAKRLHDGHWDGDIDTLPKQPDLSDWRQVQANASACTGSKCEYFKSCAFFRARRQAASATLQVANHALILATLQSDSTLIDPGKTLFVFDEAHHLPEIAGNQFSYRARLGTSIRLLASLRTVAVRHGRSLPPSQRPDPVAFAQSITECTDKLSVLEDLMQQAALVHANKTTHRFAHGRIPPEWVAECEQLLALIRPVSQVVDGVIAALTQPDESLSPTEREECTRAGVELSVYLGQLDALSQLVRAWTTHDKVPWAKWIEWVPGAGHVAADALLCASPMTAAQHLSNNLWKRVSAAVCTSATLTACGRFDFFDRLSGMNRYPQRTALVVASPFDYAVQGELHIAAMTQSPKQAGFSEELCRLMPTLLRPHKHGQLALFTSKAQMNACYASLSQDLRKRVLMQGDGSRAQLLKEHARRVEEGERSILFGLQSFGEGIDLPGTLCEHVIIDKLPFTPPNSPVEEALAEWLGGQGRDPFSELSVPRAAMKLAQWSGRGVRTITDHAIITVCDIRLVTMRYGQQMLAGLPPFPVVRHKVEEAVG